MPSETNSAKERQNVRKARLVKSFEGVRNSPEEKISKERNKKWKRQGKEEES